MAVVVANVATDPVVIFNYFHAFHPTESSYTRTATGVRVTLGPNEFTDFDGNFQYLRGRSADQRHAHRRQGHEERGSRSFRPPA